MTTWSGVARQRLLMPQVDETTFSKRGFHTGSTDARQLLERSAGEFLVGLRQGLGGADTDQVHRSLAEVDRPFRGFAHEGAAMGLAITDALTPGRGGTRGHGGTPGRGRLAAFATGPGADHIYMIHVGAGWALARLPRLLWRRAVLPDPLLRWLALDGYGFHQAYFATEQYVWAQPPPAPRPPWPDPTGYATRALDQGIGRALWFVHGADVEPLAAQIDDVDPGRRSDLWAGVGLAATYAGGVSADDLDKLMKLAAGYRAWLAQGAAFAAQARVRARLVTAHTGAAVRALCRTTVEDAAGLTQAALVDLPTGADSVGFEIWRQRIRARFVDLED
jgi:hypothetical protein